jgi:hypothetical protein
MHTQHLLLLLLLLGVCTGLLPPALLKVNARYCVLLLLLRRLQHVLRQRLLHHALLDPLLLQ